MSVIRCRECRSWLGRLVGSIRIVRIVPHSDEAEEEHDVVRCGSCGTIHEIERRPDEEAA